MSARDVLGVLGAKYSLDILEATDEARSAQALSEELDIPLATCYRRLEALSELDLLAVRSGRSPRGRQTELFRRDVDGVRVTFGPSTTVTMEERAGVSQTMDRLWDRQRAASRT